MKLKERGIYVYDGKYCSIAPNRGKACAGVPDVAEVFMAALAYTYVQSKNMEVAAKYAAVAVAAYIEKGGGITAIPDCDCIAAYCRENDIN
jgi:sugar/nucleoside kinase (ribokinase family)